MAGLIENWPAKAQCANAEPDALFVSGAEQNIAKRICRGCPVQNECLADALDNRTEYGVWGGKTERERRAMLRRHPEVTSWWRLFDAALRQHDATADTVEQQTAVAPAIGDRALRAVKPLPPQPNNDPKS